MARRHDEHVGGRQEPLGVGPEAEHARAGGGELVALGAVAGDEHRRAGNAARGPDGEQRVLAGLELAEVEDRDLVVAQAELGAHGGPVHGWRRLDGVVDDLEAPGVQRRELVALGMGGADGDVGGFAGGVQRAADHGAAGP